MLNAEDSPVSNNGRGLKQEIHTMGNAITYDSPVSNNGRGLKRVIYRARNSLGGDSPVSNNGRGLKQLDPGKKPVTAPGFAR